MRIRTAGRHRARHSENGMPKESIALRGGRCDSPMIVTRMPISRHTLSASASM